MEYTPERHGPAASNETERSDQDINDELLDALPAPSEAPSLLTAVLTDEIHESYFNALSEGGELTTATARAITYCLLAHAPADTPTASMEHFTITGAGSHAELRAEYLPLYEHPEMVAEGKLLLDALGTHLFREEHPDTVIAAHRGSLTTYALDGGLAYLGIGADRVAVAFQLPMGLHPDAAQAIMPFLERTVTEYGDAFRAFLRLPGVDVTTPGLIPYFLRTRIPAEQTAKILAGELPPPRSGGDMPSWEGVEIGGQIHAFTR